MNLNDVISLKIMNNPTPWLVAPTIINASRRTVSALSLLSSQCLLTSVVHILFIRIQKIAVKVHPDHPESSPHLMVLSSSMSAKCSIHRLQGLECGHLPGATTGSLALATGAWAVIRGAEALGTHRGRACPLWKILQSAGDFQHNPKGM